MYLSVDCYCLHNLDKSLCIQAPTRPDYTLNIDDIVLTLDVKHDSVALAVALLVAPHARVYPGPRPVDVVKLQGLVVDDSAGSRIVEQNLTLRTTPLSCMRLSIGGRIIAVFGVDFGSYTFVSLKGMC